MDQDRPPPRRASNRSCVAHRRADLPETGLRSSQRVLARTTDVSASSLPEATLPTMQASLQSTLHAPTIFESWLPMDSDIFRKGNCNARAARLRQARWAASLHKMRRCGSGAFIYPQQRREVERRRMSELGLGCVWQGGQ